MEEPLPSDVQDVESLVLALYEPATPEAVAQIQEILHRVQRSSLGWQIARDLLGRKDDKVKFFGALTILVKLNTESSTLTKEDTAELLRNLLGWLSNSLGDGSGALVVRKLTSALVALFIQFPDQWGAHCVRHVCFDLSSSLDHSDQGAAELARMTTILPQMEPRRIQAALWFTGTLVDEAGKIDVNSAAHLGVYNAITENVPDAVALISRGLVSEASHTAAFYGLQEDSVKCLQSWVWFSQRVSLHSDAFLKPLRTLVDPVITAITNDHLYDVTAEFLTDILSNYSGFLTEAHYQALFSLLETQWAADRFQRLVEGDFDFDSIQFGQLMISLGDSRVQYLIQSTDHRSQSFLVHLRGLLSARGYPVGEDKIFVAALEFWSTFVETLTDCIYSDDSGNQVWMPSASSHVLQAISSIWRKIAFPPSNIFSSWDSVDRAGFGDARKDVADLLQSTYTVTGSSLVSTFANLSIQSVSPPSWADLEAATFCLGSLADCVVGDASCDDILRSFFSSSIFGLLQTSRDTVPPRVRQSCVSMLERYADYFERNNQSLPDALNLLFTVLSDPSLSGTAAKSISRLCSHSRSLLASEAKAFLDQYQTLSDLEQLDCLASERIVGAIASVIQAVPEEDDRLGYLERLLDFLQSDVQHSLELATSTGPEMAAPEKIKSIHRCSLAAPLVEMPLHLALKALRCLITMGRGLQAPVDGPVDLDGEDSIRAPSPSTRLAQIQSEIISMIVRLQTTFPYSTEVCESICNIFRTGFSESELGPFVFPPKLVCEYLAQQTNSGPRIGLFVSTACSFISSLGHSSRADFDYIVACLLAWVIDLLRSLAAAENDTELAQNSIEFVSRLISRKPEVLFQNQTLQSLEYFFFFTLEVLDGREPLPKAAAADFWAAFLSLKNNERTVQTTIDQTIAHLGPSLAQCIVRNIGGNASRSELDKLSEPLKKLVNQHVQAQGWLKNALFDPSFPGQQVSREERAVFLKKVVNLRGSRATNQIVREFWVASRGSKFAYAS